MATSVENALQSFATSLAVQDYAETAIKGYQQEIVSILKKHLEVVDSDVVGAYARRTLLAPLESARIDLLVVVDYDAHKLWHNAEGALTSLRRIEAMLTQKLRKYPIQLHRHSVEIDFPDVNLAVIPGMRWHLGGYLTPDTEAGTWLHVGPRRFTKWMGELDRAYGGRVVPLILMVKSWNRDVGNLLRNFHIECLVYDYLTREWGAHNPLGSYAQGLSEFLVELPTLIEQPCMEPVFEQRVDRYLDEGYGLNTKRREAVYEADNAAEIARIAADYARAGNSAMSLPKWREVLGSGFARFVTS